MPSTDGQAGQAQTCRGEKDDGEPCRSTILGPDGWCDAHRPGNAEEMRERARRGGKATARQHRAGGLNPDELPELTDHESVKAWLRALANGVASGDVDRRRASELRKVLKSYLDAHRGEALDERLEEFREILDEIERYRDDWGPGAG